MQSSLGLISKTPARVKQPDPGRDWLDPCLLTVEQGTLERTVYHTNIVFISMFIIFLSARKNIGYSIYIRLDIIYDVLYFILDSITYITFYVGLYHLLYYIFSVIL